MDLRVVITADIVESRKQGKYLKELPGRLKGLRVPSAIIPFTVSRGDELQAVLDSFDELPAIIRRLRYTVKPLKLRVGVGIGEIDKMGLDGARSSWELSGEAFFNARTALEEIKSLKIARTFVRSGIEPLDTSLNTIFLLLDTIVDDWTEKQWEAVHIYEQQGTYEKAASLLGVSIQNVQQRCKSAKWKIVRRVEENIIFLLNNYLNDQR